MNKNRHEKTKHSLGWFFTKAEEMAMARAIRNAVKFMATYGKGRQPFMVDLSHYENSRQTAAASADTLPDD